MIGFLSGIILQKQPPQLLLDVNGVGYEITASMNTFYNLPEVGAKTQLYTHLAVREDALQIYGFRNLEERSLFRELIKVSGVGPKLAITILSSIEPKRFAHCVQMNDTAALVSLPGIGKKTAERLVIEMRDRLKDWQGGGFNNELPTATQLGRQSEQDAISALISLGYKPQEASRVISKVDCKDLPSEEIIRLALKSLVR
ncbi:MAG: Holliday junction branch migration protein RuvA [Gammaproteobacteria bacterium]|nr:Holliday junction branch migration protein RuvA [Gammaproteobacteria bacterium]